MNLLQPERRITLIGSGTCRIDPFRGPTSGCVVMGPTTYIIDLGCGALDRLELAGAFDSCHELHIHISHHHIDHVFGLFPLLQCLAWSDDARHLQIGRVVVHATHTVCSMIQRTLSLWDETQTKLQSSTPDNTERSLVFRPGPDTSDWTYQAGELTVHSVHLPAHHNHGVSFSYNNRSYAFTCDATELTDSLVAFCAHADVCVFDLGHLSSKQASTGHYTLSLDNAATLLARANPQKAYAAHTYLRHMQHRLVSSSERAREIARIIETLNEQARALGFTGQLVGAEDGMVL
jgi:glyoxylase-like metal-dependent hydrolase (beta-lactamase superfamily II)